MDAFSEFRESRWWVLLVRPLIALVLSLLVARLLISLVGSVDWQQVATALGQLGWAQAPLLLALLLTRQAFNSVPLAVFVPGLGFMKGFQNDLSANLVGTVAPPPGDVYVRIAMFRSWGIPPVDGMPGVTLNSLAFYVIRFSIPVLGVLMLIGEDLSSTQIWLAVLSLVVAAVNVGTLLLVARGERGVLNAALVVAYAETTAAAAEPEIVAALVVWRVLTLIGTLCLGALTFVRWHWLTRTGRLSSSAVGSQGIA